MRLNNENGIIGGSNENGVSGAPRRDIRRNSVWRMRKQEGGGKRGKERGRGEGKRE